MENDRLNTAALYDQSGQLVSSGFYPLIQNPGYQ